MEKCILKLIWNYKASGIVNTILEKKNKVVGLKKNVVVLTTFNLKTHYIL